MIASLEGAEISQEQDRRIGLRVGQYLMESLHGEGGFGAVCLGRDTLTETSRPVAVNYLNGVRDVTPDSRRIVDLLCETGHGESRTSQRPHIRFPSHSASTSITNCVSLQKARVGRSSLTRNP